jgi:MFS family permease
VSSLRRAEGCGVPFLVDIQLLGGIGVGLLTALNPLLLSDLMRGTGHYNLAQGAIATVLPLGVSSSGLTSELVVGHFGYSTAFCTSAILGAAALVLLWFVMPETHPDLEKEQD